MSTALVTSSNLGADIDVGVQVANKLNIVKATTAIYGKMRFATSAEASAYTAGLVMDGATTATLFGALGQANSWIGQQSYIVNVNPMKLTAQGTAQGQQPVATFYSTFVGSSDNGPRRTADIWGWFNGGAWGYETLSIGVGTGGSTPNDAAARGTEVLRLSSVYGSQFFGPLTVVAPAAGDNSTKVPTTGWVTASFATTASIAAALPSTSTAQLYGGSTSAGTASTVTVGSGLSLSGGTLTATGGALSVPIRQTVQGGPTTIVSGVGFPNFLPSTTSGTLTLTTQNISTSAPLNVTGANGFGSNGAINTLVSLTSNVSWTATASTNNYLFINASSGATFSSTLQPIYQYGNSSISTANGQFTFDYQNMIGYLGNGSAAVATPLVCVGECVASASAITSTIAYAYNGYYDSGWLGALPSSAVVSKNANLGLQGITFARMIIECTSADNGYSVGDEVIFQGTPSYSCEIVLWQSRNLVGFTNSGSYSLLNKSTSAGVNITLANWKYKLIAQRGF